LFAQEFHCGRNNDITIALASAFETYVFVITQHLQALKAVYVVICFPVFTLISPKVNGSTAFVVFSFVIAILLIYTHRKNIERLKAGTESKTFIWKPRRVKLDDEERKKSGKEHDRE